MTSSAQIAKDLFCGCMAGWGQVVSMLPFQNIKIKIISKPEEYNQGFISGIKKTVLEEGIMGLYKGMLFPLIGVGAQVSVQFGVVETIKKILRAEYAEPDGSLHPKYSFIAGLVSGIPSALIVTPLDHSRFKVTLNKEKGEGSIGMAKRILRENGLKKLYLGFLPTLIRESIGLGCFFGVYDYLMYYFRHDNHSKLLGSLICGACAGVSFWLPIYPVDYVKTIVQGDSVTKPKYDGNWHCAMACYRKGGVKIFFSAFDIMMGRAIVSGAFGFLCFQLGKKILY